MKPSNRVLQCIVWDESYKGLKEKDTKIETTRRYEEYISKPQSLNSIHINRIKNFINVKSNSYRVEGVFFKQDGKMDGSNYE